MDDDHESTEVVDLGDAPRLAVLLSISYYGGDAVDGVGFIATLKASELRKALQQILGDKITIGGSASEVRAAMRRLETILKDTDAKMFDECKEDLCQQEDREEADKWKRDSERQSQLEKEAEIAVWQAFHPSHLPAVGHEADLSSHIAEIEVPVHADDPLAEAVAQMPEIFPVADDPFPDPWEEYFSVYDDIDTITCATLFPTTPTAKNGSAVLY